MIENFNSNTEKKISLNSECLNKHAYIPGFTGMGRAIRPLSERTEINIIDDQIHVTQYPEYIQVDRSGGTDFYLTKDELIHLIRYAKEYYKWE